MAGSGFTCVPTEMAVNVFLVVCVSAYLCEIAFVKIVTEPRVDVLT